MSSSALPTRIIALLTVGLVGIVLAVAGEPLGVDALRLSLGAVSAVPVLAAVYDRWLWRWSPVAQPDVSGTWKCELTPTSGLGEGRIIEVYVVIRQTARTVHVSMMTEESRSESVAASIVPGGGGWTLSWTYRNEPRHEKREVSEIHYGGVRCEPFEGRRPMEIVGGYFTDRRTHGDFHSVQGRSTRRANTFKEARTFFESSPLQDSVAAPTSVG